MNWTQAQAIEICRNIEAITAPYGCHVALTGGCLYKDGAREDLDIAFYPHGSTRFEKALIDSLFSALRTIGIEVNKSWPSLVKATVEGKPIDFFITEYHGSAQYDAQKAEAAASALNFMVPV